MSKYVVGIDMGYRNMGVCVVNFANTMNWRSPIQWENVRVYDKPKKPSDEQACEALYTWVDQNYLLLLGAEAIVLERQMRRPYLQMNTIIWARFHGKTHIVAPQTLCATFKLPQRRKPKKAKTLQLVHAVFQNAPPLLDKTNHDAADAAAHCLWYLLKFRDDQCHARETIELLNGAGKLQ